MLEEIKRLVELYLKIKNIESKNREKEYVFARYVAFRLSKDFTSFSLQKIADVYNRDHATVLHGLKEFRNLKKQKAFHKYEKVYKIIFRHLFKKETLNLEGEEELNNIDLVKTFYRIKHIELVEKSHKVINKYKETIHLIETKEIFKELAQLDKETFKEFETRAKSFLIMNKTEEKCTNL